MKALFSARRALAAVALIAIALVGFGAVRVLKARPQVRPPHTVVYKLTTYDESGQVIFRSTSFRSVSADGIWQETQILPDGSVKHMHGQLQGPFTNRVATSDMPEHLGLKYFEENTQQNRSWVSPDLQDYLRYESLYDDGSIHWTLEAVEAHAL